MYFYKWRKSHFTRLDLIQIGTVNDLFVYTTDNVAIVVTVEYVENTVPHHTVLNVYTLADDEKVKHIQLSYLDAATIFPVTFNNGFYFYVSSHSGINIVSDCDLSSSSTIFAGGLTSYKWDNEKFVKFLDYKGLKNVVPLASAENLIICQVDDRLLAFTNVKLTSEYEITRNFVNNITKIVITKSNGRDYITVFYQSSDDLHMTTVQTDFEDVVGK